MLEYQLGSRFRTRQPPSLSVVSFTHWRTIQLHTCTCRSFRRESSKFHARPVVTISLLEEIELAVTSCWSKQAVRTSHKRMEQLQNAGDTACGRLRGTALCQPPISIEDKVLGHNMT